MRLTGTSNTVCEKGDIETVEELLYCRRNCVLLFSQWSIESADALRYLRAQTTLAG